MGRLPGSCASRTSFRRSSKWRSCRGCASPTSPRTPARSRCIRTRSRGGPRSPNTKRRTLPRSSSARPTGAAHRLTPVASLKPAYLVCGDDDPKIDAWRSRVRKRAEDENGPGALEAFDGKIDKPDVVAAALMTLTFATGDRYLLVDGVEAWKAGELEPPEAALAVIPEHTVLVLVAPAKPLAGISKAVENAGGEDPGYAAPNP